MIVKRGAVIGVIGILAACTSAPAREVKEPVYDRPGIRNYEHISAVTTDHRVATFYDKVFWAGAEALAGAQFAGSVDALAVELGRQAAVEAARVVTRSAPRSGGVNSGGGGDCYSRKPAGFPDYVIDRESGGDPNATNGAHDGCAQIADSHFNGGACSGMSYDACWSKLWNGGAGASNWSQTL